MPDALLISQVHDWIVEDYRKINRYPGSVNCAMVCGVDPVRPEARTLYSDLPLEKIQ
jgi:hypothetical protein